MWEIKLASVSFRTHIKIVVIHSFIHSFIHKLNINLQGKKINIAGSKYTNPIVGNLILNFSRNNSNGVHVVHLVLQVMQLVNQAVDGFARLKLQPIQINVNALKRFNGNFTSINISQHNSLIKL